MSTSEELKRLLGQIADIARDASHYAGQLELPLEGIRVPDREISKCTPKWLPKELSFQAVEMAIDIRPENAPTIQKLQSSWGSEQPVNKQLFATLTSRFWGLKQKELTVSFLEGFSRQLQRRILEHMNTWSEISGPRFVRVKSWGDVRISNNNMGTWSYVGTDIKLIAPNKATTNFDGIDETTSESKLRTMVLHQTGHLLGFPHPGLTFGHQCRLDRAETVRYLEKIRQVDPRIVALELSGFGSERSNDQSSVMDWQFPHWLISDGKESVLPSKITPFDESWIKQVYPS